MVKFRKKVMAVLLAAATAVGGNGITILAEGHHGSVPQNLAGVYWIEESADGAVLQDGGLLKASEKAGGFRLFADSQSADLEGAGEAILQAWDSCAASVDVSAYQISSEQLKTFYYELINRNPRYFYVKSSYTGSADSTKVLTINLEYTTTDLTAIAQMRSDYDDAVNKFLAGANSSWSELEKVVYINDYLARLCAYDMTKSRPMAHNAYGALVEHSAVCQGYSLAFQDLAGRLGLTSCIVTSSTLNHAWNMVSVNGKYYMVDVTWDDPTADKIGRAGHSYLLKSTANFKSTTSEGHSHNASDWVIDGGLSESMASDTTYDSYLWDGIDTGFEYIDGNWYNFNGTDAISRYTCDGVQWTKVEDLIALSDLTWYVWGTTNGYWPVKACISLASHDGMLYYTTPEKIIRYDVSAGAKSDFYVRSTEEQTKGYFYGIAVTPGQKLLYLLDTSPNISGSGVTGEREFAGASDATAPTVTVAMGARSWMGWTGADGERLDTRDRAVTITSPDSDVAMICYYLGNRKLTEDSMKNIGSGWTVLTGDTISLAESGTYYIYASAIDKSGNVGYTATSAIVADYEAPLIKTDQNKTSFVGSTRITITDDNLARVTVNGKETVLADHVLTLGASDQVQKIVATDRAGNSSTLSVNVDEYQFNKPVFDWAQDYKSAKATFVCSNDANQTKTYTVPSTVKTTAPDCESEGSTVYTVSVDFEGITYTDTKTVPIAALGHKYGTPSFSWSSDYSSAEVVFVCTRDGKISRQTAKIKTVENNGYRTYTATVDFEGTTYSDLKNVVVEKATDENVTYSEPTFTWSADYLTAKAVFVCTSEAGKTKSYTLASVSRTTPADCDSAGETVYTVSIDFGGKTYTDTKTEVLPALGHSYGAPVFEWSKDYSSAEAARICQRDGSVQKGKASVTVTHGSNFTVYTAAVVFDGVTYQDSRNVVESGSESVTDRYSAPEFVWSSDFSKVTVTFVCINDANKTKIFQVASSVNAVLPTCETAGKTVYTASIEFGGKTYSDMKSTDTDALGHSYEAPVFIWSENYKKAQAVFICTRDGEELKRIAAVASTIEDGYKIYTATVVYDGTVYHDTKRVETATDAAQSGDTTQEKGSSQSGGTQGESSSQSTSQTAKSSSQGVVAVKLPAIQVKKAKSPKAGRLKVTWKKSKKVSGYEIQYSTKKNFKNGSTKRIKDITRNSLTIKNLKRGKRYYVRVRTYKKVGKKTYYGSFSDSSSVKIK